MAKWFIVFVLLPFSVKLSGQTCCSGGIPVSSNIGYQSMNAKTFQFGFNAEFNILKTLKSGNIKLEDDLRLRSTQSYMARSGYSLSDKLEFEMMIPLIRQTRRISSPTGEVNMESTFGIGDPILLALYNINTNIFKIRIGGGPQIPLGSYTQRNSLGLTLLEDLQPGSGAWDLITFFSIEKRFANLPSGLLYANFISTYTGTNMNSRNGTQSYEFGNDLQVILGFSNQYIIGSTLFSPGLSLRYRNAQRDAVNGEAIPGTGGQFLFARISNQIPINNSSLNFTIELPFYSKVNETQLSPSLIINVGWHKAIQSNSVDLISNKFESQ